MDSKNHHVEEHHHTDHPPICRKGNGKCITRLDGYGKKTGRCGDTIEFMITVENGRLEMVSYRINGCEYTDCCARTVAAIAEGKTVEQAWEMTPDHVSDRLPTLPADHFHCAELAAGTLYLALTDYQKEQSAPNAGGTTATS